MEDKSIKDFRKVCQSSDLFSKKFTTNLYQRLLYCQELLNRNSRKKQNIKQWQLKLTSEEKIRFDEEEILSPYQHIIANSCAKHQTKRETKMLLNRSTIQSNLLPIHQFCRKGVYPGTFIQRQQINDEQVPWTVDLPNYNPSYYTDRLNFITAEDIDSEMITSNFMWNTFDTNNNVDRRTANPLGYYPIDDQGYPLNILGRTGLRGRGILKRWAVNYQTHLVIMCGTNEIKSDKEIFKYMMKTSPNNDYYALPSTWTTGTNMNAITKTLRTYLFDIYQSWNSSRNISSEKINQLIDHITFVSTAYIDDPRNTDNAWLETSVCCYIQTNLHKNISSNPHLDLNELFPQSSETYTWHPVSHTSLLLNSERDVIKLIAERYNAYW